MKKARMRLVFIRSAVSIFFLSFPPTARAAAQCDPSIGKMVSVQGNVVVLRLGQTQPQAARLNETYCPGDRIQVGDRSRADVQLANQPLLRLDQNTLITLAGTKDQRASIIDMARGALHFFSRLPRNLEVNTAFVNAGVEGTEGLIQVEADQTLITIFEGRVLAANPAGTLALAGGQSAVAARGQPPILRTIVRPRDAVQWALYYPPVTYFRPEDFQGPEPWQPMVQKSLGAYSRGDYQAAFDAISTVPPDIREPRFFAYRAQLLLGVGRVDEASKDIERALSLNSNDANALALQSIIAVVQNDKQRALDLAGKAVAADPKSGTALVAQSYAQQANFDLESARTSLERAVQAEPNNALAWARLAEIHMSFARLDEALEAAQKAVSLNPDLSRTQMVLGFAYLTRVNTTEARRAFDRAIELDQADSLARLGLGLAKIRESNFEEGRKDIEVAASLDPNNSNVRSYLGKAYYEEKRSDVAEREYATAKELDPKDPTAYFYDAIQKQTTNRPVEALQDMERAIELNDNRAVYRSRLQLDADLAARSASLGRIYTDLGFQQLALVEGWKSVNTDPTNFSAHRFLADSYAVLPRHEIARVSELLQAQLLQPLNMTPIQPQLAESNLGLISAGGPGALSFNEFNPIFNRDGVTFQMSGLAGENSTYSGEGVLAGIYKKMSFSLGGFHFKTDGFRTNADQKDSIGNAFLQFELSPSTSIQGEYRYRRAERGDLQLRFFPEEFFPGQRTPQERHIVRFGARHAFSPESILLGSFTYQHAATGAFDKQPFIDPGFITFLGLKDPAQSVGTELQHLFRSRLVTLTSGIGHFYIASKQDVSVRTVLPPPDNIIRFPSIDNDFKHVNVYAYANFTPVRSLTITLGASGDFTRSDTDEEDINQFNPKVGFLWSPLQNTTIRGAVFRSLKRTLITDQTLEPTQVAGFNQFFDDFNKTKAWRYGGAIDQKFTSELFGGVEFAKRDSEVPAVDQFGDEIRVDWKENLARTYLFWTPLRWLALRGEYQYERVKRDQELTDGVKKMSTHRVPLGINLFHPSGVSALFRATYFNQDGTFESIRTGILRSGRDNFWTVDTAINYRLPKRYGFLTLGVTNLFDKKFKYFDTDFKNPSIQPDRVVFVKATLALP
jgi:tetratricopeptide (TPR) repeat protein